VLAVATTHGLEEGKVVTQRLDATPEKSWDLWTEKGTSSHPAMETRKEKESRGPVGGKTKR